MQEAQDKSQRLSIERCRELLGEDGKQLTDEQVGQLRDALYTLAENVLDKFFMCLDDDAKHD